MHLPRMCWKKKAPEDDAYHLMQGATHSHRPLAILPPPVLHPAAHLPSILEGCQLEIGAQHVQRHVQTLLTSTELQVIVGYQEVWQVSLRKHPVREPFVHTCEVICAGHLQVLTHSCGQERASGRSARHVERHMELRIAGAQGWAPGCC